MTATGYVRQSAAQIISGNTIQASDFNNEYNKLQDFASDSIGHDHSGGTGLGPKLALTTAVSGILPVANGGTGIANSANNTITFTGNYTLGLTLTGNTAVTLPTSGTLLSSASVGTITSGTWNGTIIAETYGGTGVSALSSITALTGLITVGTIGTGTWQGTAVTGQYGGTGVANTGKTITLGGNLTTSGSFGTTLTVTNTTSVTLPTSGTLVNTAVTTLSSLTSVGTIGTGVWQGTIVTGTYGGTGVNNGSNTITLAGNISTAGAFTTSGAFGLTLNTTALTSVTLPTSGTLLSNAAAVTVAQGGTGAATFTAYSVICAGTTATGAFQNVVGVGTAGQTLSSAGAAALPTWKGPNTYTATPGDPTATTSTTAVMMGLAGTITPATTGSIMVFITGTGSNATGSAGFGVNIRYGTGAAPANGAALTGTAIGIQQNTVNATATAGDGFSCAGIVTGLTVNTAYWIDISLKTISAGTASLAGLTISAYEIK